MILLFAAALLTASSAAAGEPMLDADCGDHASATQAISVGAGVNLYIRETADHVWICFTAPAESFASTDVELETPAVRAPVNLHASAQLGEWNPLDRGSAPTTATDERWWKISGWTGTTNHFRLAGTGGRLEFLPTPARELQISKARFGRGEWRMKLKIAGLKDAGGTRGQLSWPSDGTAHRLAVE